MRKDETDIEFLQRLAERPSWEKDKPRLERIARQLAEMERGRSLKVDIKGFQPSYVRVETEHQDDDGDWCDLVVSLSNDAGHVIEVQRHRIEHSGCISHWSPRGRLVKVCSWTPVYIEGVKVICPQCLMEGHCGIECEGSECKE